MLQLSLDEPSNSRPLVDIRTDELGIDSLNAVEIRSWFLNILNVNVPVLRILGGVSIGDLLEHALNTLPQELVPCLNMDTGSSSMSDTPGLSVGQVTPGASDMNDAAVPSSSSSGLEEHSPKGENFSPTSSVSELEQDFKHYVLEPTLRRKEAMSYNQSMLWFVKVYLEDQTTLNHTGSFHIQSNLRVSDLEKAVQLVEQRHEALRTCFFADEDSQLKQGVLEFPILHLEKKNISEESELEQGLRILKEHVFDIERGETIRIVLLSRSSVNHYLVIGAHHINVDGISQQILMSDLKKAYNHKPLGFPVLQYPDFSLRQREEYATSRWDKDLMFWRKEFPNFPQPLPLLSLSKLSSRRTLTKYAVHKVDFRIDSSFAAHIQKICRQLKATPFHFYFAAFKTLLFRYLDIDDLCIGIRDGNRVESDMLDSIGPHVNLLLLRFRLQPLQIFSDALKEARMKTYSALAHSKPPLEVLLNKLDVPRSSTCSPLLQAFVDYRQGTQEQLSFGNCQLVLKDKDNALTYEQMVRRANSIATSLLDANIEGGSIVAVFQEPTSDYVCSLLVIMRIEATYLPLDMGTPLQRLTVMVNDSQPSAILTHAATEQ